MYLGVGWAMAVLAGRARNDLNAGAQRWYLLLVTILWPVYVVAILCGSLVAVLWWVRR
jgi:hypothetical protein